MYSSNGGMIFLIPLYYDSAKMKPKEVKANAAHLQDESATPDLTRQQLIAELDALRAAGAFDRVDSLRDQYANPALKTVSDQQLRAAIREAATEYQDRFRLTSILFR